MASGSPLLRRLRVIEGKRAGGFSPLSVSLLSDADLYRVLDVRDAGTGKIRTDLTDGELQALVRSPAKQVDRLRGL